MSDAGVSKAQFSPLNDDFSLPRQVHVLSLQVLANNDVLLRLQNIYELGSSELLEDNEPVKIDFQAAGFCNLFGEASDIQETLLNGLPTTEDSNFKFRASAQSIKLDRLGSRGGAAAEKFSRRTTMPPPRNANGAGSKACRSVEVMLFPQDIKTFRIRRGQKQKEKNI